MAAAQPARFGAPGGDIADWMAQRWRDIANLGPEAADAGRRLWAQATRSGQNVSAPNPSDIYALGAQYLSGRAGSAGSASQQQGDPSQSRPNASGNTADDGGWSDYPWQSDNATSPAASDRSGLLQLAAAPGKGFWDYWGVQGCANCHGYRPDTLPPYGGQSPFPPNSLPRRGGYGGGGSGSTDSGGNASGRNPPQCAIQYDHDSEICRSLPAWDARQRCWASATE